MIDVRVATELELTGKPAQFGRSIISDVGSRLIDQFAGNVASLITAAETPAGSEALAAAPGVAAGEPGPGADTAPGTASSGSAPFDAAPLDALSLVPPLLLVGLGWLLGRRRR